MDSPSVFIGLVSYGKSKFAQSQGNEGLATALDSSFTLAGWTTTLQINTQDFFDMNPFPLTRKMARASVLAEINAERSWTKFLQKPNKWRQTVRILLRYVKFYFNWQTNSDTTEIRRLLNIEASHIDLYKNAVDSGAIWSVILEDDASCLNTSDLITGLESLMNHENFPEFINLSRSFSLSELDVTHLLRVEEDISWSGLIPRKVYASKLPVTNTVCAIAFRTDFLARVLSDFASHPSSAILPIDWKLNETLVRMWTEMNFSEYGCWFVDPAPVIQRSMLNGAATE